ncbi:GNAT family N-acetyltransferase [Solirubrobacter ginsenosidimutans]|uniref:GNAT family N-acetyltransferase n=1 Tax=Solirubrobacter ginsenosidimutans TaxID=490573 RepID=A0A9X3MQJ9_9ACTN|nr:GNAT family N-acetyltransferase [Solirubrobacter ginsenosidimutans]MDA0160674.1 GNAT family N-acetyltransferase [Solirubrobacter ginsenosidimutans]
MDDAELRRRLWEGFAALQTLLGGSARNGWVLRKEGLVASVVPSAPDSPALNAAVALNPEAAPDALTELEITYGDAGVRRWAVWIDGGARHITSQLRAQGLAIASASPGMGATIEKLGLDLTTANAHPNAGLRTVGRVNDLAYGNVDSRLERTLTTLQEGTLRGYRADMNGAPGAVALALHHGEDCGVSFVATVPQARRHGLATQVMRSALADAQNQGLTTITLQATELGERLYQQLGLRRLGPMELWEHRR